MKAIEIYIAKHVTIYAIKCVLRVQDLAIIAGFLVCRNVLVIFKLHDSQNHTKWLSQMFK